MEEIGKRKKKRDLTAPRQVKSIKPHFSYDEIDQAVDELESLGYIERRGFPNLQRAAQYSNSTSIFLALDALTSSREFGCPYKGVLCKAKRPSIVRKTKTELMDWVDQHLATEKA